MEVASVSRKETFWLSFGVVVFATCAGFWYTGYLYPRRKFESLLAGSENTQITSLRFSGQGVIRDEDDAETMDYLSRAFRSAIPDESKFGASYDLDVSVYWGGSARCAIYIPNERGYLTIGYPLDGWNELTYYLIKLPDPIPPKLIKLLDELR